MTFPYLELITKVSGAGVPFDDRGGIGGCGYSLFSPVPGRVSLRVSGPIPSSEEPLARTPPLGPKVNENFDRSIGKQHIL